MSNTVRTGGKDAFNGVSRTHFGQSVESQAQMEDAAREHGHATGDEELNVYRLVPIAAATDTNWQNAPSQGEVIVAARTAGDARIVATDSEEAAASRTERALAGVREARQIYKAQGIDLGLDPAEHVDWVRGRAAEV